MAVTPIAPSWPPILALLALWAALSEAYFADWSVLGGRPHEPTCVDIPRNMSLCSDIGYSKMRLPNLLDHDTLTEVQQQSGSWVPLLNVQCHPHTKLFLCSLFTPVCLESEIFPCRSLCNAVQKHCESRMRTYGYYWPDMLRCEKFPLDNDMCIKAPDVNDRPMISSKKDVNCTACNPVDTYENILDNFCRANTVLRARIRRQRGKKVSLRKMKVFKSEETPKGHMRRGRLLLGHESACCKFMPGRQKYLIMGMKAKKNFISPTFVLPWRKSKALRQAIKIFPTLNCADPNLFTATSDDGTILPRAEEEEEPKPGKRKRIRGKSGRKRNRSKSKKKIRKRKRERKNRKNKNANEENKDKKE